MQIRAEPEKSALSICNYSQILYQFFKFTQNLKQSLQGFMFRHPGILIFCSTHSNSPTRCRGKVLLSHGWRISTVCVRPQHTLTKYLDTRMSDTSSL